MFVPPHNRSLRSFDSFYSAGASQPTFNLSQAHSGHTSQSAYSWEGHTQPSLISFRDTSMHAFPTHRSAALLLFESLHPHLYGYSHTLHSLVAGHAARLSNTHLTVTYFSTADYEAHLRQHAFDTLWQHPQWSDHFRDIWQSLIQHTAAVEWREWERTVSRLYAKLKGRMERADAEEAEEQRRMALQRAQRANVEDGEACHRCPVTRDGACRMQRWGTTARMGSRWDRCCDRCLSVLARQSSRKERTV